MNHSALIVGSPEARNTAPVTRSAAVATGRRLYRSAEGDEATRALTMELVSSGPSFSYARTDPGSNVTKLVSRRGAGRFWLGDDQPSFDPIAQSALRWMRVGAAIAEWRMLRDDWDGDDAVAPTTAQLRAVEAFVKAAEVRGLREPRPYLAPDGEVGFHWDGEAKATASFLPARFLAFCPRDGREPLRIAGPLDIAACSGEMFEALAAVR